MDGLAELLTQAFEVVKGFKDAGLLMGLVLLVNLLVNATKLPWIDGMISKVKWLRAPLALALGASAGLLGALAAGKSWAEIAMAVATGLVAGLGSVGLHEVVQSGKAAAALDSK